MDLLAVNGVLSIVITGLWKLSGSRPPNPIMIPGQALNDLPKSDELE